MELLIAGLLLFIGGHSVKLAAPAWRTQMIARIGLLPWKGIYSLIAASGIVLMVIGYGQARIDPLWLWQPPLWLRHVTILLTLPAFILLFASQIPGNILQAKIGHPMYAGIKVWSFSHLLANGGVHDILLFGSLMIWGILGFLISRRRDKASGVKKTYKGLSRDLITLSVALGVWAAVAFWLHALLIGVKPF